MSNPFQFISALSDTKQDLLREDPELEKEYKPFFINRSLSYFPDSVFEANEMNMRSGLDVLCQQDFYINSLRKRKRFSKWSKSTKSDDLEAVMEYFQYGRVKAEAALRILTGDDIITIKKRLDKGGIGNDKRRNPKGSSGDSSQ